MTENTSRLSTALADRYRIERRLGEGGMATVYLAEDVKHDRKVAVKVLRPELAAVLGAERFVQEIKTTANLQHPHILPLFDSGEADSFLFYVMPFIDGETLRGRLDRESQLGIDEAVRITREIADALDYAHGEGVIHRDIKPENILIHNGRPMVADFGIALAVSAAAGGRMTETGLSLGTPHYMSPEQATAEKDLTARADIYSLGSMLYEMLTGEPPHMGNTAQQIIMKIVTDDARPVTDLRKSVPPNVAAAVAKSLEKLAADRFESAAEFSEALGNTGFTVPGTRIAAAVVPGEAGPWKRLSVVTTIAAAVLLMTTLWGWLRPDTPVEVQPVTRALIDLADIELRPWDRIVISPDGERLTVTGLVDGESGLYVRNSDEEQFRPLPNADEPVFPSFSPDGEWIVYVDESDESLMKIAISGGAPRVVVPASDDLNPFLPHWGDDGTIVFATDSGAYRVPDTGGDASLIVEGEYLPELLPGGRGVLLNQQGGSIHYTDLVADTVVELIPGGIAGRYSDTGHLLYMDATGGLWAVGFDADRGIVTGDAVPVLEGVTVNFELFARYDVSNNGTLVYGAGGGGDFLNRERELLIVSLDTGNEAALPLAPRNLGGVRWAPDGERVAYSSRESGDSDSHLYVYNVELSTTPQRLTFEGNNFGPIWAPDGGSLAFQSNREGTDGTDIFVKSVDDDSPPTLFLSRDGWQSPSDWADDSLLVFLYRGDVWTVQISDTATATDYLTTEDQLRSPQVAPQGDLLAYTLRTSGEDQVYLRSFPTPRQPVPVSTTGGSEPRWSPDGNRVYFWKTGTRTEDDSLFVATVIREPTFAVTSTELVHVGVYAGSWDLHPDGDRFIAPRDIEESSDQEGEGGMEERHLVVTNWFTELRARLGEN